MKSLDGKAIVVTGALGALGRAVSTALEDAGARVARVDQARAEAPAPHLYDGVDLTNPAATGAAISGFAADSGRLDGLVNIAGGFVWKTVADADQADWRRMFEINVLTAVTASRAALPHLSPGASIVNIGANAATRAAAGMAAYAAAKSGVARLTEALAEELAARGVRVNAVLPSIIDTPANRRDMPGADATAWVAPRDLARVVLFLLSDESRAVTGAAIPVTRGSGAP